MNIEKGNISDYDKDKRIMKLLLLGAGESGKSTLFKQMIDLYGTGFDDSDIMRYIPTLYDNTLSCMKILLEKSEEYCTSEGRTDCGISSDNQIHRDTVMNTKRDAMIGTKLADAIKHLWSDPGIQHTYELRSNYQLAESASYFFERIDAFAKLGFVPTKQDILRARIRTTGITETNFEIEGSHFQMMDVGGQRNERKKWIHSFQNVTAVIFVAAISGFDQTIFEDNKTNRIEESLQLFEDTTNSPWFIDTPIILFLNKCDLLEEKLKHKSVKDYMSDYSGDNSYEDVWKWFATKYEQRLSNGRPVYTHVTCAMDDQNVLLVFQSVRDIVIQKGMESAGLV